MPSRTITTPTHELKLEFPTAAAQCIGAASDQAQSLDIANETRRQAFVKATTLIDGVVKTSSKSLLRNATKTISRFLFGLAPDEAIDDASTSSTTSASSVPATRATVSIVTSICNELQCLGAGEPDIPTALVVMGVNEVDHNSVYQSLITELSEQHKIIDQQMQDHSTPPFIVPLRSKDCPTRTYALNAVLRRLSTIFTTPVSVLLLLFGLLLHIAQVLSLLV
jgi:L-asparagine transporter-like permease